MLRQVPRVKGVVERLLAGASELFATRPARRQPKSGACYWGARRMLRGELLEDRCLLSAAASAGFEIELPVAPGDGAHAAMGLNPFGAHIGDHLVDGHPGWDIEYRIGANVLAAAGGIIDSIRPDGTTTSTVQIRHSFAGKSYRTVYTDIESPALTVGQPVTAGQAIGTPGTRTTMMYNHTVTSAVIHFQLDDFSSYSGQTNPYAVNPEPWLSANAHTQFAAIWCTAAYGGDFVEPFVGNSRDAVMPITRSWTLASGDFASTLEMTRHSTYPEYTYQLHAPDESVTEEGIATVDPLAEPYSTIDLAPAGGGPLRRGIYDSVGGELLISLGAPSGARPGDLSAASYYTTALPTGVAGGIYNAPPIAAADAAAVDEDGAGCSIDVLANDRDPDNVLGLPSTGLIVSGVTQGAQGAVVFTSSGVSYTPAGGYSGPDSFTYTVLDVGGATATATVSVTINAVTTREATNLAFSQPALGTYGGSISLTASLTSDGAALPKEPIAFSLNGTSAGTATTDASGVATISAVGLAGLNVGTYTACVGAGFAGDANYTASSATADLTVNRAALVGTVTVSNKLYDGTTSGCIASRSLSGVIGSDQVMLVGGEATLVTIGFNEVVVGGQAAANYELRAAGADGLLGTGDDLIVPLSVTYSGTSATLTFSPLAEGVYCLTIRDTITDNSGNRLDGDANGTAGGDWVRDFVVLGGSAGCNLDADGNGTADALTDGILILRYLFDPGGQWNYSDALGSGATRTTRAAIKGCLDQYNPSLLPSGSDSAPRTGGPVAPLAAQGNRSATIGAPQSEAADRVLEQCRGSPARDARIAGLATWINPGTSKEQERAVDELWGQETWLTGPNVQGSQS